MKLSDYTQGKDNNFNLARLASALAVLVSHSFALLAGSGAAEPLHATLGMTPGSIAVDIFFITSGFLLTGSLLAGQDLIQFVWSRVLRIYPALLAMVALTVLVLGPAFTTLPALEFLTRPETANFALRNSLLVFGVSYSLPGVFESLPWKRAVNGSLWTLPVEISMYATLAGTWLALGLARQRRSRGFAWAVAGIALGALIACLAERFWLQTGSNVPRLLFMFFAGAGCRVFQRRIPMSGRLFLLAAAALAIAAGMPSAFFTVYCLTLAYLLLWIAHVPGGVIRQYNRLGDYSYGLYIYAFPVQQSLIALMPGMDVAGLTLASAAVTLALAVLSWHGIEKRALGLRFSCAERSRRLLAWCLGRPARGAG